MAHLDVNTREMGEIWLVGPKNNTRRVISLCVLLVVSFFAASFPVIAKRSSYLRTPRVLFFVGKFFGTGVILATAFIHLLKDAFENMAKAKVNQRWGRYESWPGLVIMSSLLFIFLIEYTSTVYVEHLAEQNASTPAERSEQTGNSNAPKRPGLEHAHTECLHGEVVVSDGEATKIVGVFVSRLSRSTSSLDHDKHSFDSSFISH
ncbi:hypothetical protein FRC12_022613 [Ceratobasidium sp. 428]|nr:hypothetical protein FRC12_022613 [Ceratobasidium sp. 428]